MSASRIGWTVGVGFVLDSGLALALRLVRASRHEEFVFALLRAVLMVSLIGADFKRQAREWKAEARYMVDKPFEEVKNDEVRGLP